MVHRLAAGKREGMSKLPSTKGDGAPKSANLWLASPCGDTLAPLGAPIADVLSAPTLLGAAPRPASQTPHDAPFKWTR